MPYNEESKAKHRATLLAKFDGDEAKLSEYMAESGRAGGRTKTDKAKGFAADNLRARQAGKLGANKRWGNESK